MSSGDPISPTLPQSASTDRRMWAIIFFGVALRCMLYAAGLTPVDGDETILGLMAYDLQNLTRVPVYFYHQHYMGSIEIPPVALLQLLGPEAWKFSMWPMRLTQLLYFVMLCVIHFKLCARFFGPRAALWCLFFLCVAPFYWMDYSSRLRHVTLMMFFGELLALLTLDVTDRWNTERSVSPLRLVLIGLISGIAWWHYQLVAVYFAGMIVLFVGFSPFVRDMLREPPRRDITPRYSPGAVFSTFCMAASLALIGWLSFGKAGRYIWEASDNRLYWHIIGPALGICCAFAFLSFRSWRRGASQADGAEDSRQRLAPAILALSFVIGYAPAWLYYLFLNEEFWVSRVDLNTYDIPGRLHALLLLDISSMLEVTFPSGKGTEPLLTWRTWVQIGIYGLSGYAFARKLIRPAGRDEFRGIIYFLSVLLSLVALHILTPRPTVYTSPRFLVPAFSVTSVMLGLTVSSLCDVFPRPRVFAASVILLSMIHWGGVWIRQERHPVTWPVGYRTEALELIDDVRSRGVQRVWLDWGTDRVMFGYELQYMSHMELRVNRGAMGDRLNGYVDESRWTEGENYFMVPRYYAERWEEHPMLRRLRADSGAPPSGAFVSGDYYIFPFPDDMRTYLPR